MSIRIGTPVARPPLSTNPDAGPQSLRPIGPEDRVAIVLDDEDVSRRAIARAVGSAGNVAVAQAGTVQQVFAILQTLGPAPRRIILFSDVLLPELSSEEGGGRLFIHRMRLTPCFGQAPIVLVSALAEPALIPYVRRWGANGYIEKAKGLLHMSSECATWLARV